VREIMTPRPHIQGLAMATPPEEVLRRAVVIGHSRIPVYRDSMEQPVGIIVIKDLLRAAAQGAPFSLPDLLRPPLFIPETSRISVLLREFQRHHQSLALVVDEHGSVVGLVTLEDMLEEIVGEIRGEGEVETPPFAQRLPDGSYVLDGFAPIRDVRTRLALPVEESSDYQTVAGFLIHSLGAIPKPGASIAGGGYRWTVVDMEGPKITKVKVEREPR
jgi:CBS domain containing-hemolysin-like protein